MPRPNAMFHQNWRQGFREKNGQDTQGHSFIIIRLYKTFVAIFLRNRNTNFDETWYMFDALPENGSVVLWDHITHKQKIQNVATEGSESCE